MTDNTQADYLAGYRVVRKLGEGRRGIVYLGAGDSEDPVERTVALKVFVPDVPPLEIMAELDVLARVPHEHCVHLLDASTGPDGRPVAVVSRATGGSVGRLLHRRGSIAPAEAVTIMAPLARTVAELHGVGIAHTQISASTVHFADGGSPQLLGFGHARLITPDAVPAILDHDEEARRDRRALAQLARLLLRPDGQPRPSADLTAEVDALLRWIAGAGVVETSGFPAELEERLFALCEAEPVDFDAQHAGGEPVLFARGTPSRVDGSSPVRSAEKLHRRVSPKGNDLADRLLGAAPMDPLRARVMGSLQSVRARWWIALGVIGVAIVAVGALVPGSTALPVADELTHSASAAPPEGTEGVGEPDSTSRSSDPVVALPALWTARARCLSTEPIQCLDGVDQPNSALHRDDSARIAARAAVGERAVVESTPSAIALVALLGDAAVLEFTINEKPASVLMIRTEAGWRLRTLFSVEGP